MSEVQLGKVKQFAEYGEYETRALFGYDSAKLVGKISPNKDDVMVDENGAKFYFGELVDDVNQVARRNVYAVYNPYVIKIRYLVVLTEPSGE